MMFKFVILWICLHMSSLDTIEGRSVHGLDFSVYPEDELMSEQTIDKFPSSMLERPPVNQDLWYPENGSRDEWMRFHGMSRDRWHAIVDKIRIVDQIQLQVASVTPHKTIGNTPHHNRPPPNDRPHKPSPFLQKGEHGLDQHDGRGSSRVEEGCMWYTEQQIQEVLDEATEASRPSHAVAPALGEEDRENVLDGGSGSLDELVVDSGTSGLSARSRQKRKVENMEDRPDRKWQNPIVFKFDGMHNEDEKRVIRDAIWHWENKTCLKFFELNFNAKINRQHLLFTKENYGCYSFVGKIQEIPQQINLAAPCMTQAGIPVHEIGHALGLWHEQQRGDRDEWIRVNRDNIGYYSSQFWRRATVSHGVPYDYGSVMHYASTAGSRSSAKTMEALDPVYTATMGQRVQLSYMDAKIINMEYCRDDCRTPLVEPCQRGGYQDPDHCEGCLCPDGFAGQFCQHHAPPVNAECGGEVYLTPEATTLESPGYSSPGYYEDFTECTWLLKAPRGHNISLTFEADFAVFMKDSVTCFHWVEVKYKVDFEYPGPRLCGYNTPNPREIISETNEMAVIFKTNFATAHKTARGGFRASVTAVPTNTISVKKEKRTEISSTPSTTTETQGTGWSDWSHTCLTHECKCGGCSVKVRTKMCGENPCTGDQASIESIPCDRRCTQQDTFLQYTGKFIKARCPVCCSGFSPRGDKCQRSALS